MYSSRSSQSNRLKLIFRRSQSPHKLLACSLTSERKLATIFWSSMKSSVHWTLSGQCLVWKAAILQTSCNSLANYQGQQRSVTVWIGNHHISLNGQHVGYSLSMINYYYGDAGLCRWLSSRATCLANEKNGFIKILAFGFEIRSLAWFLVYFLIAVNKLQLFEWAPE